MDRADVWRGLGSAEVDRINVDDLEGLSNFLKAPAPWARPASPYGLRLAPSIEPWTLAARNPDHSP